ncbi:hypothetical protein F5Y15DRAFT_383918 [Xylariaceae sp. FL0016]|nr:hypothetical protein F5Y15DRAFT_383918 [Xylariaceae sp. FL0016]
MRTALLSWPQIPTRLVRKTQASTLFRRSVTTKSPKFSKPSSPKKAFPSANVQLADDPFTDASTDFEPGQHIVSFCRTHEVYFPGQYSHGTPKFHGSDGMDKHKHGGLKSIRVFTGPGRSNKFKLQVAYSKVHCFSQKSFKYLDRHEHPFTKTLLDIYEERTKKPLWYSCSTGPVVMSGACHYVTSRADKRIEHALRDALLEAGYDRDGRAVAKDEKDSGLNTDLYGTLTVSTREAKAVCKAKFVDLLEVARWIILETQTEQMQRAKGDKRGGGRYGPKQPPGSWAPGKKPKIRGHAI